MKYIKSLLIGFIALALLSACGKEETNETSGNTQTTQVAVKQTSKKVSSEETDKTGNHEVKQEAAKASENMNTVLAHDLITEEEAISTVKEYLASKNSLVEDEFHSIQVVSSTDTEHLVNLTVTQGRRTSIEGWYYVSSNPSDFKDISENADKNAFIASFLKKANELNQEKAL